MANPTSGADFSGQEAGFIGSACCRLPQLTLEDQLWKSLSYVAPDICSPDHLDKALGTKSGGVA